MKLDLTGHRFGRLIASHDTGERAHKRPVWRCTCDCGATIDVPASNLRSGNTRSCGCLRREIAAASPAMVGSQTTHGLSDSPEYAAWEAMKARCLNPNQATYRNYGGRGITICDAWVRSFPEFLAHIGPMPPSPSYWASRKRYWSLDRIDNDGNYEPGNVRWATYMEQRANQRPRQRGGMQ